MSELLRLYVRGILIEQDSSSKEEAVEKLEKIAGGLGLEPSAIISYMKDPRKSEEGSKAYKNMTFGDLDDILKKEPDVLEGGILAMANPKKALPAVPHILAASSQGSREFYVKSMSSLGKYDKGAIDDSAKILDGIGWFDSVKEIYTDQVEEGAGKALRRAQEEGEVTIRSKGSSFKEGSELKRNVEKSKGLISGLALTYPQYFPMKAGDALRAMYEQNRPKFEAAGLALLGLKIEPSSLFWQGVEQVGEMLVNDAAERIGDFLPTTKVLRKAQAASLKASRKLINKLPDLYRKELARRMVKGAPTILLRYLDQLLIFWEIIQAIDLARRSMKADEVWSDKILRLFTPGATTMKGGTPYKPPGTFYDESGRPEINIGFKVGLDSVKITKKDIEQTALLPKWMTDLVP